MSESTSEPVGRKRARGAAPLLWALLATCCQAASDPATGGETHFLKCQADVDCRRLSDEHICVDRICQVPASLPGPVDAGSPPEVEIDAASDAASPLCVPGSIRFDEIAVFGDSFFGTTHEITRELEVLANAAGSLPEGEQYRDYSRLGRNALAFMGEGIADQYTGALEEGPVKVVIMNGGGADALLGTCDTVDAECSLISEAVAAASALFETMANDGVVDVVYAFYPDPVDERTRQKVDALRPLLESVCAAAPTRCHWLDLRQRFAGNYDSYIAEDGLNPTTEGARATAEEIWTVMQRTCAAQ